MLLKRSLWSLLMRPGNSLVLLIISFVLCTLVLSSLSIQASVEQSNRAARQALGAVVILKYDLAKYLLVNPSSQGLQIDDFREVTTYIADQLTTFPHVVGHNYFNIHFMMAEDFNYYPLDSIVVPSENANVSVHEVLDSATYTRFVDGVDTLITGHHLSSRDRGEMYALIERHLAELNHLKVNDILKISSVDGDVFTFQIAGIYESSLFGQDFHASSPLHVVPNKIYVSFGGMADHASPPVEETMSRAYYHLDDPEHIYSFIENVERSGIVDFDVFHFDANEKAYFEMTGAMNQVASISLIIQWLVIGAGTIIVALILILTIRSRLREIGILLSLGEKRFKVMSQLLIEMLIILCVAFSLAVFVSQTIAQNIANTLLHQQAITLEEQSTIHTEHAVFVNDMLNDLNDPIKEVEPIYEVDVSISSSQLLKLILIGLGITITAILIPAWFIVHLKPREILIKNI